MVRALALCIVLAASLCQADQSVFPYRPARKSDTSLTADPRVCVVIRTYWGHAGPDGLLTLLRSLQRQSTAEYAPGLSQISVVCGREAESHGLTVRVAGWQTAQRSPKGCSGHAE